MTDNRISDPEVDRSVHDGLRVLGLIDNGDVQPTVPNLPPELPSEAPKYQLVTRLGANSR